MSVTFISSESAKHFHRLLAYCSSNIPLVFKQRWHKSALPGHLSVFTFVQVPHLSGFEASKQSVKNRGLLQSICLFLEDMH